MALSQQQTSDLNAISSALRAGEYAAARQMADQTLQSSPNDVRVLTLKAIALSKLGQSAEAISSYRRALALSPQYLPALAGIAELEYRRASDAALG